MDRFFFFCLNWIVRLWQANPRNIRWILVVDIFAILMNPGNAEHSLVVLQLAYQKEGVVALLLFLVVANRLNRWWSSEVHTVINWMNGNEVFLLRWEEWSFFFFFLQNVISFLRDLHISQFLPWRGWNWFYSKGCWAAWRNAVGEIPSAKQPSQASKACALFCSMRLDILFDESVLVAQSSRFPSKLSQRFYFFVNICGSVVDIDDK